MAMIQRAHAKRDRLARLKCGPMDSTTTRAIRYHLNVQAVAEQWIDVVGRATMWFVVPLCVAAFFGPFFALAHYLPTERFGTLTWVGLYFVQLSGLYVFGILLVIPFILLDRHTIKFIGPACLFTAWTLPWLVGSAWWTSTTIVSAQSSPLSFSMFAVLSSIVTAEIYGLAAILSGALASATGGFAQRRCDRLYVHSAIVSRLFELLTSIERAPARWMSQSYRRDLVVRIEEIASRIEQGLPRGVVHEDGIANRWSQMSFAGIAAGTRELKRAVLTPKSDTRGYVLATVANALAAAARGEWDRYPRLEVTPLSRAERRAQFWRLTQALVSAMLPLTIFLGGQELNLFSLGEPVRGYIQLSVWAWMVVSLLSVTDPAFGSKLTLVKDVTGLVPIPGLKKRAE